MSVKTSAASRIFQFALLCSLTVPLTGTASAAPWKFAIFSDSRYGKDGGEDGHDNGVRSTIVGPMAAAAVKDQVSLVIFPGDLTSGQATYGLLTNQWAAWKKAMSPLYDAGIPVYVVRGNHEDQQDDPPGAAVQAWRSFFPELPQNGPPGQEGLTYKVEYQNASFIGFDEFVGKNKGFDMAKYDSTINSGMISPWVIDQIKQAKTPWVFAFAHESAFFGHHVDCLANVPAERDQLWDALGAKGGVYLSGHDHLYVRRTAPDSANHQVLELVVGCGGAPFYPYDNAALNAKVDRHVRPVEQFINAGGPNATAHNTNGHRVYYGYVLITIDGRKLTGEWKAFTNYDYDHWTAPAEPKFETLDTFTWTLPDAVGK